MSSRCTRLFSTSPVSDGGSGGASGASIGTTGARFFLRQWFISLSRAMRMESGTRSAASCRCPYFVVRSISVSCAMSSATSRETREAAKPTTRARTWASTVSWAAAATYCTLTSTRRLSV